MNKSSNITCFCTIPLYWLASATGCTRSGKPRPCTDRSEAETSNPRLWFWGPPCLPLTLYAYRKTLLLISGYRPQGSHSSDLKPHNLPIYSRRHLFFALRIDQLRLICCDLDEICLAITVVIFFSSFILLKTTVGFEPTNTGVAVRPLQPAWAHRHLVAGTGVEPAISQGMGLEW